MALAVIGLVNTLKEELFKRMKRHREVKWSEVLRRAIADYLQRHERKEVVDISELREVAAETGIDLSEISVERAIKHYHKMGELEWKRAFTTRA